MIGSALLFAVALALWGSRLSLIPLPWPDDSAFALAGADWVSWPSRYRMLSQSPFVPSYESANFNTMPALPLITGVMQAIGLDGIRWVRLPGYLALAAWALALARIARAANEPTGSARAREWLPWGLALAALLSPTMRWGSGLVRPEIWVGLAWALFVIEALGRARPWVLAACLAGAAYFHFEAVYLVPGAAVFLAGRFGSRGLGAIAWRVVLLLSPWIAYVLAWPHEFAQQMGIQFARLAGRASPVGDGYELFHGFFPSLGNPVGMPKLFNPGKALTWVAFGFSTAGLAVRGGAIGRACAVAALCGWVLWISEPEVWFASLAHALAWVAVAAGIRAQSGIAARAGVLALLALEVAVAGSQWFELARKGLDWGAYQEISQCVARQLAGAERVWQPHLPDFLVDTLGGSREAARFRHDDFSSGAARLETVFASMDAVILTPFDWRASFSGELRNGDFRPGDRRLLADWSAPASEFLPPGWSTRVCANRAFRVAIARNSLAGATDRP